MDGDAASNPPLDPFGRYHVRYYIDDGDPFPFQSIAVGTAHHEVTGNCGGIPKHIVDHNQDNGGLSGFDMAREDIKQNWTAAGHVLVEEEYWGNSELLKQCDFDPDELNYSYSNGVVIYLTTLE